MTSLSKGWMPTAAAAVAVATALVAGQSSAQAVTFFGEDPNPDQFSPLTVRPNADAARASFLSSLTSTGTETFEGFTPGVVDNVVLNFGAAGTGTLTKNPAQLNFNNTVNSVPTSAGTLYGMYPISGDKFYAGYADFSISFGNAVDAIGFYGTDIGDFNGQLTLTLVTGGTETINVPHSLGNGGGNAIYFGYIADPGKSFTKVTFGNNSEGRDIFGFDDISIGSRVQTNPVPTPALLPGLIGVGVGLLRKRNAQTTQVN
jgi:hypothetical protein